MNELVVLAMLLVPLAAAVVNGANAFVGDRWLDWRTVQRLTVGATLIAFACAAWTLVSVLVDPTPRRVMLFEWVAGAGISLRMGLLVDLLSALMAVMVTGFAFVIGRFSINYMHRERGFTRYFAVYALFVFAMLVLVLGDNYVLLFVGWEAVGVCSYLLIGQYFERDSAARASTEAFVANRVGDAGFIVAILILLNEFGTADYAEVAAKLGTVEPGIVAAVAGGLLLGAVGKSAQLPLGSWLAKAMEGPTPSSALIHAATMVTAGVYLIVRSQPLYNAAPDVLMAVAVIGAATALYGAAVGQTVSDIKGLLASSTTTQLGFMFLACGLGYYAVAVFHLLAHAFFKSYLFLTAPSILHHLHGRLDPARAEPRTEPPSAYTVMALVAGALVAAPLLFSLLGFGGLPGGWNVASGVLAAGGALALATVLHYALSLTRAAFVEHDHAPGHEAHHAHGRAHDEDAPEPAAPAGPLLWPLLLIALAAVGGVLLQIFPGGLEGSWFRALMAPVIPQQSASGVAAATPLRATFLVLLLAMVVYAWFTAVFLGRFRSEAAVDLRRWRGLYVAALNRFWIDALTRRYGVGVAQRLGHALDRFDRIAVSGLAGLPGRLADALGRAIAGLDALVRGAAELGPAALASHLGRFAALIERHVIGGLERGLRGISAGVALLGAELELVLSRPAVAVVLIGFALLGAFLLVG